MRRSLLTVLGAVIPLALASCGGGSSNSNEPASAETQSEQQSSAPADSGSEQAAGTLDCHSIEFIVPYSPGGGSDRQVRRLQPGIEKELGVSINPVYQTGGDGAVGWQALSTADPDGCTVGNVVSPNIVLLSLKGEDVGFKADDFSYIAWTENVPNALAVAKDSKYQTIDDFIQAAKDNPGKLTIGGVGDVGELLTKQVTEATGIDITYVPVTGGVGDIVPQLMGGHVDAGIFGASHITENSDSIRALAISGDSESDALPGIPTFTSKGYEGVTLTTSWGVSAPPGTPDDILKIWNDAIEKTVQSEDVQGKLKEAGLTPLSQTPAEAMQYLQDQEAGLKKAMGKS